MIAHNATAEIEGVSKMFESISQSIADTFNSKKHRNGVEVEFDENGLVIDVYVSIKVGYAINEVAEKIQKNIHQMIYHMTSVKTSEIYVHVVDYFPTEEFYLIGIEVVRGGAYCVYSGDCGGKYDAYAH